MGFMFKEVIYQVSKNVERCKKLELKFFKAHKKNLKGLSIVVRSSAIKNNNPEISSKKKKN